MKNRNLCLGSLLLVAIFSLTISCSKEPLKSISNETISCNTPNQWSVFEKEHYVASQKYSKNYIEDALYKFYWQDDNNNFIEIAVKSIPKMNETKIYCKNEFVSFKSKTNKLIYTAYNNDNAIPDNTLMIRSDAKGLHFTMQRLPIYNIKKRYYVDFSICNLFMKNKN
jgi:hypothetical protein